MPENEAAERLHLPNAGSKPLNDWLDAALAAERKATVERIRAALEPIRSTEASLVFYRRIIAILDAEAAR